MWKTLYVTGRLVMFFLVAYAVQAIGELYSSSRTVEQVAIAMLAAAFFSREYDDNKKREACDGKSDAGSGGDRAGDDGAERRRE